MRSKRNAGEEACTLNIYTKRFQTFVGSARFACIGAKAAVNRRRAGYGLYTDLGGSSRESVARLCKEVWAFAEQYPDPVELPASFVAMFQCPVASDDEFDARLWRHLQDLNSYDRQHFPWDSRVSSDPSSNDFSFSLGARAYFIVGLHPAASRISRRAPMPCVVFNFHDQFDLLRANGRYDRMQAVIRKREMALQGTLNPNLSAFGEMSEALQYSGRANDDSWVCPFHHGDRNAA